jgi:ribosomal protein L20A (L18A)
MFLDFRLTFVEFRDVTRTGAVEQLLSDMAGRHRTTYRKIQIMEVKVVPVSEERRVKESMKSHCVLFSVSMMIIRDLYRLSMTITNIVILNECYRFTHSIMFLT